MEIDSSSGDQGMVASEKENMDMVDELERYGEFDFNLISRVKSILNAS